MKAKIKKKKKTRYFTLPPHVELFVDFKKDPRGKLFFVFFFNLY